MTLIGQASQQTAQQPSSQSCPNSEIAVTTPAPVNLSRVLQTLSELKTRQGQALFRQPISFAPEIARTFNPVIVQTKMEQFYTLLYVIFEHTQINGTHIIQLESESVRLLLVEAGVFPDLNFPGKIAEITLDRSRKHQPRYEITFSQKKTEVALNGGQGFFLFRNGLCQHAKKLIFDRRFAVTIKKNRSGNIEANNFIGVDLFGTFGNRGIIDVDINYVALRGVEFFNGTPNGKVTAYVSLEEFKTNRHNPLLRLVTRFVPDRSVQPIDW